MLQSNLKVNAVKAEVMILGVISAYWYSEPQHNRCLNHWFNYFNKNYKTF